MLNCFDFEIAEDTGRLFYGGLRIWSNVGNETVLTFFQRLESLGIKRFDKTVEKFYQQIDLELFDYMERRGIGFSFHDIRGKLLEKNADVILDEGYAVARLSPGDLDTFIRRYKDIEKMSDEVIELTEQQIVDAIEAPTVNAVDVEKILREYDIELPTGPNKFAPDLSGHVKEIGGYKMEVKIKMTGCRANDDRLAVEMLRKKYPDIEIDPDTFANEFVWHHLDDFGLKKGECTLQLVPKVLHNDIVGKHIGAVRMWEQYFGIKYL